MSNKKELIDLKGVSLLRLRHRQKLLGALRDHPGLSRSELAQVMGVTRNTATLIVNELLEEGLLMEDGEKKTLPGAGRPGKALFLESHNILFGGCIFQENQILLAVGDYEGNISFEEVVPIDDSSPQNYLRIVSQALVRLESMYPNLQRWGIGVPGLVDEISGKIIYTARLGWREVEVTSVLEKVLKRPCRLVNRIQAASLMTTELLLAENYRNAFYLHLTTGVGGASLTLLPGGRHFSAEMREIGHFCVVDEGIPCTCGNRGCLEQYAGLSAVEEAIHDYQKESLSLVAAREKALREAGRHVGKALAQVVNLLLPDAIIVDGTYAGERTFQEQVIRICKANGLSQIVEKMKFHFLDTEKSQINGVLLLGIRDFDQKEIV